MSRTSHWHTGNSKCSENFVSSFVGWLVRILLQIKESKTTVKSENGERNCNEPPTTKSVLHVHKQLLSFGKHFYGEVNDFAKETKLSITAQQDQWNWLLISMATWSEKAKDTVLCSSIEYYSRESQECDFSRHYLISKKEDVEHSHY